MADGTTYTNIGDLKRKYSGGVVSQLQWKRRFWSDYVKTADEKLEGAGIYTAIKVGGNQAIQAQTELQALAAPQHQRKVQPVLAPKIYTGSGQISGLAEAMAGGGAASFEDALDDDLMSLREAMEKRLNIDAWRDGNAIHGTATAYTTSATQTVDQPWLFQEYAVYDLYSSDLSTLVESGLQVTSKNITGSTVTFSRSHTTASSTADVYVPTGEISGAPSDGKALTGIKAIIDTTTVSSTYLGINRSTYTVWQGLVEAAGGLSVSEDMLQQVEDRITVTSDEELEAIWSHKLQRRKYLGLVTPQKRFANLDLDAGWDALDWNGNPWMCDVDHPRDEITMFGWAPKMYYTPGGELALDERGGSFKPRDGYDAVYFYMKMYGNMACTKPNANARITGLSTPSI